MRRTRLPRPPLDGWVGYPLGSVTATVVTILAVAAHATSHPLWSVTALATTGVVVRTARARVRRTAYRATAIPGPRGPVAPRLSSNGSTPA